MKKLRSCYEKLRPIIGKDIEPYESVELVEKYRQYWKPNRVRVLLLAESHVFTTDKDRTIKIPDIPGLRGYPKEYAKFVYCLGYGEKDLTEGNSHPKKDGTPQFWKIFYSCDHNIKGNKDFDPILLSKTKDDKQRLKNKINLLKSLKEKGVWLVDASIVALYKNGKKLTNSVMSSVIQTSWEGYIKEVIEKSNPEHIIIIGEDVARIIGTKYSVIPQPNAHLKEKEHLTNFKKYYKLCRTTN